MNSICIAGASGFLGRNLVDRLIREKYPVSFITRNDFENRSLEAKLANCSIVINLVGEPIDGRWTVKKKAKIYDSRVLTTRKLVEAMNSPGMNVSLLIQVSGVARYDHVNIHTEESKFFDDGFLSGVIKDWEGELSGLRSERIRIVILRLGIVLDKSGGALKQMMLPFRAGFGFGVKSEEYFPFIEIDDLIGIFLFCMGRTEIKGVINAVTPVLTKINQFFSELASVKNCRFILWLGSGLIVRILGESGSLLTQGQQVIPDKLVRYGFVFRYGNIRDALVRACN
jgi:uncharacterized protein